MMPSEIQFVDERVEKAFRELKDGDSEERELHRWLLRAFEDIEKNVFCGVNVPKKLVPRVYIQKYGIRNLWKYDLPRGWRLMYSIVGNKAIVVSIILEWLPHKEYERRFRY